MSLEGFYGGKQGLSSVIKRSFKYISVDDPYYTQLSDDDKAAALANEEVMEYCFQQINRTGATKDYEDVWYGELCIIDTNSKNNPANGCLFRRTLTGQGSEYPIYIYGSESQKIGSNLGKLSAEYIGQIVGPKSGTPLVNIGTLDMVTNKAKEDRAINDSIAYELADAGKPEGYEMAYEKLKDNESIYEHDALVNDFFVSGKDLYTNGLPEKIKYT